MITNYKAVPAEEDSGMAVDGKKCRPLKHLHRKQKFILKKGLISGGRTALLLYIHFLQTLCLTSSPFVSGG